MAFNKAVYKFLKKNLDGEALNKIMENKRIGLLDENTLVRDFHEDHFDNNKVKPFKVNKKVMNTSKNQPNWKDLNRKVIDDNVEMLLLQNQYEREEKKKMLEERALLTPVSTCSLTYSDRDSESSSFDSRDIEDEWRPSDQSSDWLSELGSFYSSDSEDPIIEKRFKNRRYYDWGKQEFKKAVKREARREERKSREKELVNAINKIHDLTKDQNIKIEITKGTFDDDESEEFKKKSIHKN